MPQIWIFTGWGIMNKGTIFGIERKWTVTFDFVEKSDPIVW